MTRFLLALAWIALLGGLLGAFSFGVAYVILNIGQSPYNVTVGSLGQSAIICLIIAVFGGGIVACIVSTVLPEDR